MNDRFKFRVWNKQQQKLYTWDDLKKSKGDNSFYWCMLQAQNDEKNNTLMQCTGLKDKNGTLIYEGDIVKFKDVYRTYRQGIIKYTNEDALFCLSYIDKSNKKDWDYVSRYKLEVIGNIYENKELLE